MLRIQAASMRKCLVELRYAWTAQVRDRRTIGRRIFDDRYVHPQIENAEQK